VAAAPPSGVNSSSSTHRPVLDEYDPPRRAVAEAMVHRDRRAHCASPEGLGQAFNFDLLRADTDAGSSPTPSRTDCQLTGRSTAASRPPSATWPGVPEPALLRGWGAVGLTSPT
jgi:hypothetical protein